LCQLRSGDKPGQTHLNGAAKYGATNQVCIVILNEVKNPFPGSNSLVRILHFVQNDNTNLVRNLVEMMLNLDAFALGYKV